MQLLMVLFIMTCIEAMKRHPASLKMDTENLNRNSKPDDVDVYPASFQKSVDFGHVYKDSKQQADVLDADMVKPINPEQAREMVEQAGGDLNWMRKSSPPLDFASPRDSMQYSEKYRKQDRNSDTNERGNIKPPVRANSRTRPMWFDFPSLLQKNLSPPDYRRPSNYQEKRRKEQSRGPVVENGNINQSDSSLTKYFSKKGFGLIEGEINMYKDVNWTTCKDFAKGATFHPDDIINLEWMPFYTWSTKNFDTSNIHKFTYPTIKLVEEYKKKFNPYLTIKVDWEQPKLLMKEVKDTLLIAGDRKGLFYGIPYIDLPSSVKHVKITVITIRLKIVDPYLAMMFCDEHYATIMAVFGDGPETFEEKTAEATILKFKGVGNPVVRDVEGEKLRAKFDKEHKVRKEELKYINVEKQFHRFDEGM